MPAWITSEVFNIALYPFHGKSLIVESEVRKAAVFLEFWAPEPSKCTKTIVHSHLVTISTEFYEK